MFSLYSPNGQFGCLTLRVGPLTFTCGLRPSLRGMDLSWRDRMVFAFPRSQKL